MKDLRVIGLPKEYFEQYKESSATFLYHRMKQRHPELEKQIPWNTTPKRLFNIIMNRSHHYDMRNGFYHDFNKKWKLYGR